MEIIEMNDINGLKPLLPPFKIPLKPKYEYSLSIS